LSNESNSISSAAFVFGPVLLLGAPGVGKGTQAQILVAEFNVPQISTGELLRKHRADQTSLGRIADEHMSIGRLVPDELVNDMVADRLRQPDIERGYILDGYPRTLNQAEWLDRYLIMAKELAGKAKLGESDHAATLPLAAISIHLDEGDLLRRITGRRTCPVCKCGYNIYTQPSLVPGICDNDGTPLQQRDDDTEEAFVRRMKEYANKTVHVIDHYRGHGRFEEVDGSQPIEAVTAAIHSALKKLRGQKEE
jgi:adenylate kinase